MSYLDLGYVFDIEADSLKPTKIHCLSYSRGKEKGTETTYEGMRAFLSNAKVLIGHNIILYDIPALESILGVPIRCKLVDTLALSWVLEPQRYTHGLSDWGEDFGIPKPVVEDWEDQPIEVYINRCEEDVKINQTLWLRQHKKLKKLYGTDEGLERYVNYLSFKLSCARGQESIKWKLDEEYCKKNLDRLGALMEDKVSKLREAMPSVKTIVKKTKPAKPFKQDGTKSATGVKWFSLLEEQGLPEDFNGVVEVEGIPKPPNPNSVPQRKAWLDSLGWKPQTFKYKRDEGGGVERVPQINVGGGEVCDSVKALFNKEPALKELESLSVIQHRVGLLKGFLRDVDEDGYLVAGIAGFTNTLRWKHKTIVNLPAVDKLYGDVVRGCLTAPEGMKLCGSDMTSLEDGTKQHYMWEYDKEYVKEMSEEGYDPHTSLAVFAGALTKEEEEAFKKGEGDVKRVTAIRKKYKAVNYSAVYGVGATTLSRSAGISEGEAAKLLEAYWKKNWSVRKIADDATVKTLGKQKWLYNPVSGFWYTLRAEKDRFSTLNQGTGVYCFDTWVRNIRKKGVHVCGQYHDEVIVPLKEGEENRVENALQEAIKRANIQLRLNKPLSITVQFGNNYAEIH